MTFGDQISSAILKKLVEVEMKERLNSCDLEVSGQAGHAVAIPAVLELRK